jgi:predicted acetyltransferase
MIEIRRSEEQDRSELYHLWSSVFEEDPAWLERYIATRWSDEHIILAAVDGKLASALHALEASYVQKGVEQPCSYIVGAATYPEYRRQGLMGQLLAETARLYEHPITLFPAVRPFYEANGYATTSSLISYPLGEYSKSADSKSLGWEELDTIYRIFNAEYGYLVRDEVAWSFLLDGYGLCSVADGYALIKDGVAIEACALSSGAARCLVHLLSSRGITTLQTLAGSHFDGLLGTEKSAPIPMGMSTELSMQGVYIAEQY